MDAKRGSLCRGIRLLGERERDFFRSAPPWRIRARLGRGRRIPVARRETSARIALVRRHAWPPARSPGRRTVSRGIEVANPRWDRRRIPDTGRESWEIFRHWFEPG